MSKAVVISFANQKGGVGKTTTVSEVGENLARTYNKKVLMIDIDPQSSLTTIKSDMHKIIQQKIKTMSDVMMKQADLEDIIINVKENLDLAPSTLLLSDVELNLVSATMREIILQKAISKIEDKYDFILIDCPPSRGLLTVNSLSTSDYVVIPVQSEYQALLGMQLLKNTIKNVQQEINTNLKVGGYVITMTSHTNHSNETVESIKQDKFDTIAEVPRSIDVADAGVANMSTHEYNGDNKAGIEYLRLAKYISKMEK
ncbi:ParA family protein [Lactiplantibacillus plantarum]|uniref:ParA family protein n=1 Tax=Lactiplantibacillus plantarum TaxID=1590 RepID=UPI001BACB5F4|nr:AAA family ATPase [Lactiplantibacillus plantarum]MBS0938044.1 ParA family protein [Lactiplantibacillus plantarum]MBS0945713.1 ParA family protein [Lactiplantibacillus plantarum]